MAQGGIALLSDAAVDAEDPQTLRMVAGAIANLCGNGIQCLLTSGRIDLIFMKKYLITIVGMALFLLMHFQNFLELFFGCVFFFFADKLQSRLRGEGGIRALLEMVRCGHPDVLAQVARGIANFAKCESRASSQGIFN